MGIVAAFMVMVGVVVASAAVAVLAEELHEMKLPSGRLCISPLYDSITFAASKKRQNKARGG